MTTTPHKKVDVSKYPDQNLMAVVMADNASLSDRAACRLELEKRKWRKDFWSKGIVAWIALVLSVVSIILNLLKYR